MRTLAKMIFLLAIVCSVLAIPNRTERIRSMKPRPERIEPIPRERPMSFPVPYFMDFEAGAPGWTMSATTTLCRWQWIVSPSTITVHPDIYGPMVELGDPRPARLPAPHSGNVCFWYGNPENGTFIGEPFDHYPWGGPAHTGGNSFDMHSGSLTSPLFETAGLGHISFSFWTWWEVECIDINAFDMMYIEVSTNAGVTWDTLHWLNPPYSRLSGWEHWQSYSSGGYLSPGMWIRWIYFLDPIYVGHDIMLRFEFDTRDNLYNGFRGWFIDDVYVSGGLEEAHLIRSHNYPNPLLLEDCKPEPNPFSVDFIVENIGGQSANDVVLFLELPPGMSIFSGFEMVPLGAILPREADTVRWELSIDYAPLNDTIFCWNIILTSADSLIGYHDNFEGEDRLFTGDSRFGYCDVRLPNGPNNAVTGFGIAGIPKDGSPTYPPHITSTLTSVEFDLTGWTEAYLAFWYWLSVPSIGSGWSLDGEDGFIVEVNVNRTGWTQLDPYGVGILTPRYDAYIDAFSGNPLANRMAYCDSTGAWKLVVSQNLIDMGIVSPGDILQVRFVFGSSTFTNRQGLFIDEFRLSTVQYPIGPFLHTLCVNVPGSHIPQAVVVMPLDGKSTSCPRQELVLNCGAESMLDPNEIFLWVDSSRRFSIFDGNMEVRPSFGLIVAQPPVLEIWTEGWHLATLDTCRNIFGCNIDPPIQWSFFVDLGPPKVSLIEPSDGVSRGDNFAPLRISISDTLTGVDPTTIGLSFCGTVYNIDNRSLFWNGNELSFYPESTGTNVGWSECPNVCIIAGDRPDYCQPNIDTTCFEIIVVFNPPNALLISPQNGQITACANQRIYIALADSEGIDPNGAVIEVDGRRYISGTDPELNIVNDTLIFNPSFLWRHGDTIRCRLLEYRDIWGITNTDTLAFFFIVDLQPPEFNLIEPTQSTMVSDIRQKITFELWDNPAGIDLSSIEISIGERVFYIGDVLWNYNDGKISISIIPSGLNLSFVQGETVEVTIAVCDSPDLCAGNCAVYAFDFNIEPKTSCLSFPNPFTPNSDGINDVVMFDYPRSFSVSAELLIFDLRNNLIVKKGIDKTRGAKWDGTTMFGEKATPGIYLYLIKNDSEVLCSGTIVLIR